MVGIENWYQRPDSEYESGGWAPLPEPPAVRDVGGAYGASLRAWVRRRRTREDGLTRSGEAHSYPHRPFAFYTGSSSRATSSPQ